MWLTIIMFQYNAFQCDSDEVHNALNVLADDGWRLHTCDPVTIRGGEGVDSLFFWIVMERLIPEPDPKEGENPFSDGMAMG